MSNIKVGGKVFRDIEKMNLEQLHEVRAALVQRMQALYKEGLKLSGGRPTIAQATRIGQLNNEMEQLDQRVKRIDALAKPLVKKDTATKLAPASDAEVLVEARNVVQSA